VNNIKLTFIFYLGKISENIKLILTRQVMYV